MKTDILAIGDVVIDAFIRLKEAEVRCDEHKQNCKLCLSFADKVPYESVEICKAVGNSANASVSAARLGLNSALLSYVGNDRNGDECVEELQKNNVHTEYVRKEDGKVTNYHYVLWYDVDRTILVKHETYNYSLGNIEAPKWIYLSSMGENSLEFHMEIADFLDKNPDTKLVFQPGTFQMKFGKDALARIYKKTDIFFCNVEESQRILGRSDTRDLPTLMKEMMALGPKIVCITDGIDGAYAYDGTHMWFMSVYPHVPFERTGAGDAFASTVTSALLLGKTLEEAMMWGPINSMSVVQKVGAQKGLLTRERLEEYLRNAPTDYKPRLL
ncbi:MAG: carbohydrate kinase family protein [bacterium]